MNFKPSVYYPKRVDKPLYNNLVKQCELMDIPFLESCPDVESSSKYRFIADGLFGFSFKPPIRDTFMDVMKLMSQSKSPVCCIDIPSTLKILTRLFLFLTKNKKAVLLTSICFRKICLKFKH